MATLALSMILKNGAATLRSCLQSVAGIVDQIVIADTGSTDESCAIAREFGATVISFPWTDHFADARNAALAGVTTDWVLVLDADEELDPAARHSLPMLMAAEGVGGYRVPIVEYLPPQVTSAWTFTSMPNDSGLERAKEAPTYMVNELCRLFRRRSDIYFTGRVHELVLPQIEKAGLADALAPFSIHHFGHLADESVRVGKRTFYHDLLMARLSDDPTNVTTLALCAMDEWEVHGRPLEALRYLEQALRLMPNALEPMLLAAKVLCALHRHEEALVVLQAVAADRKYAPFAYTVRGNACYALGRLEEARGAYRVALALNPGDRELAAKLEYLGVELGDAEGAIKRLQHAAAECPTILAIHEYLVNAYIRTGRTAEAAEEAERFATTVDRQESLLLKAAALRGQLQQWSRVESLALQCLASFPQSVEGHRLLMMAYVASGRGSEAAEAAEALTELEVEPGSFLRAASIHAHHGGLLRARAVLVRGLQVFPDDRTLGQALREMGADAARGEPGSGFSGATDRDSEAQMVPESGARG
ncbi:MAG TPA: glycosyltransferase [Acidobacteriaceae bacterium]